MKRTLTFAAALALGAAVLMPLPASAQVGLSVFINAAPPAPRYESVPAPRDGYVWAPGFWNYEGNRHVWTAGHWESARQGYQFQRAEWQRDNDGWRLNRGGWQQVADRGGYDTLIRVAPPAPRYERVPRARPGYVWVPGYWNWNAQRHRHQWVAGTWVRERQGYYYNEPRWVERDGRWMLNRGAWARGQRDRDRDGVPNRMDRDRDGDGVPNRLDSNPNNPRRN